MGMVVEQSKGTPPSCMEAFERMCSLAASQELPIHLESVQKSLANSALPSNGYIRPYLESFPAYCIRKISLLSQTYAQSHRFFDLVGIITFQ